MFYSRKINKDTKKVEVWECEWTNKGTGMAKKKYLKKVGDEDTIEFTHEDYSTADAVCWSHGTTIGNIAVCSEEISGFFDSNTGDDALLPCQIIPSGKFRHGAKRWYCKTHQIHWGTKADFAAALESGEVICSNALMKMSYAVNPIVIEFNNFEEIGIWCSLPEGLSSDNIKPRPPKIHVHKRLKGKKTKFVDKDYNAVVCINDKELALFPNKSISKIQITPPAAFEFVNSIIEKREMSCVSCKKCGYPHLDLGDFAKNTHRKHFCGNCGNDSVWSTKPIVSTPLKPLHDLFENSNKYIYPTRTLNLDEKLRENIDCKFNIWASTPAIIWNLNRPQEMGIHVHAYNIGSKGKPIVDDTYASVIYKNKELDREVLLENMIKNTLY